MHRELGEIDLFLIGTEQICTPCKPSGPDVARALPSSSSGLESPFLINRIMSGDNFQINLRPIYAMISFVAWPTTILELFVKL